MPVINSVAAMQDEIAGWRHTLHQNPQTAYEEEFASSLVAEKLTQWGIPFKRGLAKTGIVATIAGRQTDSGRALALRADMDALDITEKSGVAHASKIPGKMHACGHDGHTAMLLGAARYLSENPNFNGKVHLIFQPAEEGGGGAMRMIEEGLFRDFPCDFVFGLHNWPYLPIGQVLTRVGPIMAAVDVFRMTIRGLGGHAAVPDKTIDPLLVAAYLVTALQSIVSRNVSPIDTAVVSVTNFNAGTGADNIIDDQAVLTGTVRTFNLATRGMIQKRIADMASALCASFGATFEMDYRNQLDPTINTADGVELAVAAAVAVVGEKNVDASCSPFMGGEDFGAFLLHKPGAYIGVGQSAPAADSPHNHGLHSPYYDFNDDILPIGISWFAKLVERHMPL